MNQPVLVTKARLPRREDFYSLCDTIFDAAWLTNNGPCVRQLEQALSAYLGTPHLLACNNGTTALMLALHCAGLADKKVAITPFTYVATLSALLWLGCTPVFIDIDPDLCLSPWLLRRELDADSDIAGVLAVHIYGMACDTEALGALCCERGLPLIYDAAQAFGSRKNGKSLLDYGDYSICSFHATKIFHTVEGGCVITHGEEELRELSLACAFGHVGDEHFTLGINAKLSELHAAMGLSLLPGTDAEIEKCRRLHTAYDDALNGLNLAYPSRVSGQEWNFAYYPVLLPDAQCRERALTALNIAGIYPRRYFTPALNTLPYLEKACRRPCPVAEDAASRVLCLPMYGELKEDAVTAAAKALAEALRGR